MQGFQIFKLALVLGVRLVQFAQHASAWVNRKPELGVWILDSQGVQRTADLTLLAADHSTLTLGGDVGQDIVNVFQRTGGRLGKARLGGETTADH